MAGPLTHARASEMKGAVGARRLVGAKPSTNVSEESQVMKVRPLQDRVIVQRIDGEEKTKGGIIIPDSAKEKPAEGKVIAAGKGKVSDEGRLTPLTVKKGDRILFGKYSGTEIKVDGEDYLIMREDDILGVIEA
jgi:chaperonin GroES